MENGVIDIVLLQPFRAEGIDPEGHRLRQSDGIGKLHFTPVGQIGGDDSDPAGDILSGLKGMADTKVINASEYVL